MPIRRRFKENAKVVFYKGNPCKCVCVCYCTCNSHQNINHNKNDSDKKTRSCGFGLLLEKVRNDRWQGRGQTCLAANLFLVSAQHK
jgi:hypothetical protein